MGRGEASQVGWRDATTRAIGRCWGWGRTGLGRLQHVVRTSRILVSAVGNKSRHCKTQRRLETIEPSNWPRLDIATSVGREDNTWNYDEEPTHDFAPP